MPQNTIKSSHVWASLNFSVTALRNKTSGQFWIICFIKFPEHSILISNI